MSKPNTARKYGKQQKKSKCDRLFAELPQTPVRLAETKKAEQYTNEEVDNLARKITAIDIGVENEPPTAPQTPAEARPQRKPTTPTEKASQRPKSTPPLTPAERSVNSFRDSVLLEDLQVLSWSEVCPPGDKIVKIAEASYAEVYRVTNERGTSIIKVIRMKSPIRAKTKAQERAGLVDEEPHPDSDLMGELQISEWLADIPGFVMYKERYIVQGKTCRELLETHQTFHKKAKRQDPGRLQFYPSPSRYLDDTKFLVVELGDAGTALEDFPLESSEQLWDIFFHVAIALARAETHIEFEVCDQTCPTSMHIRFTHCHLASRLARGEFVHPERRPITQITNCP
jgi:serine/threonine-protein kinase haspin